MVSVGWCAAYQEKPTMAARDAEVHREGTDPAFATGGHRQRVSVSSPALGEALGLGGRQDVDDPLVGKRAVAADPDDGLLGLRQGRDGRELRLELGLGDGALADGEPAGPVDAHDAILLLGVRRASRAFVRLGQLDRRGLLQHRRGDHDR